MWQWSLIGGQVAYGERDRGYISLSYIGQEALPEHIENENVAAAEKKDAEEIAPGQGLAHVVRRSCSFGTNRTRGVQLVSCGFVTLLVICVVAATKDSVTCLNLKEIKCSSSRAYNLTSSLVIRYNKEQINAAFGISGTGFLGTCQSNTNTISSDQFDQYAKDFCSKRNGKDTRELRKKIF